MSALSSSSTAVLTRNDLLEKDSADVQYSVSCAHICPHGIVLFVVKRSNGNSNAKVFSAAAISTHSESMCFTSREN